MFVSISIAKTTIYSFLYQPELSIGEHSWYHEASHRKSILKYLFNLFTVKRYCSCLIYQWCCWALISRASNYPRWLYINFCITVLRRNVSDVTHLYLWCNVLYFENCDAFLSHGCVVRKEIVSNGQQRKSNKNSILGISFLSTCQMRRHLVI